MTSRFLWASRTTPLQNRGRNCVKQVVVSALRPAFFILYLESYISRLNEILRHDLTLSVGEPDNAAAKQG